MRLQDIRPQRDECATDRAARARIGEVARASEHAVHDYSDGALRTAVRARDELGSDLGLDAT